MFAIIPFKLKKSWFYWLIFCLLYTHGLASAQEPPKAVTGILDLTSWDFDRDGALKLDGEWEFFWQELL